MSKKPTTKTVIENLNLEIDYDKLAEAIIRANKSADEKGRKNTRTRRILITGINGIVFASFYVLAIFGIISTWVRYRNGTGLSLPISIVLTAFCVISAAVTFLCQQEAMEDDYKEALSLFTTNVALIALIVAVISLINA